MKMGDSYAESGAFFRDEQVEEGNKTINVRIKWVNGNHDDDGEEVKEKEIEEIYFKIRNDIPLRWLMVLYSDKIGAGYGTTRFEFRGARVRETDTPLQLSMLPSDVIYAYHFLFVTFAVPYATVCIRTHEERDMFLRVRRAVPLLPQLMRGFSVVGPQDEGSLCFVYNGRRLNQLHTVEELDLDDGDIIDAFNFDENSSSLSVIEARITLKVVCESRKVFLLKLKRSCCLGVLMKKYCEVESLEMNGTVFLHEGFILMGSKTVDEEHLEDGDEITALLC